MDRTPGRILRMGNTRTLGVLKLQNGVVFTPYKRQNVLFFFNFGPIPSLSSLLSASLSCSSSSIGIWETQIPLKILAVHRRDSLCQPPSPAAGEHQNNPNPTKISRSTLPNPLSVDPELDWLKKALNSLDLQSKKKQTHNPKTPPSTVLTPI